MSQPTPTTSAAALLARAQTRFQASVARSAAAVAAARAGADGGPDGAEALVRLEAELRRVQGWAASFGLRELKQQSGKLATQVRRWVDDPALDHGVRAALLGGGAERLAELATERPARTLAVSAALPPSIPAPPPPALAAPAEPASAPSPPAVLPPVVVPPVTPAPPSVVVHESLIEAPDVVVVQDDPRMTGLLMFALEQAGLRVSSFDSGTVALDALRRMRASPGRPLVILDVELPGLDGHDVHETLRAERPGMFSFVFTAAPMSDGERMRAMNAGALDYLMRPVHLRVLLAKLPGWLAPARASRSFSSAERRAPVIVGRRSVGRSGVA